MASNRSTAPTPRDALAAVARDAARIPLAGAVATGTAVAGWARALDRLAQSVGDELLRRLDGESDSRELIVEVASATSAHLRELSALPSAAADTFTTRLERSSK